MKSIKPPTKIPEKIDKKSFFLAGSIDQGKAVDWQTKVEQELKDEDIIIFNPRRDDWDSSWLEDINNKQFNEQVNWELNAMNKCHWILFYFSPESKAPITLLELGIHCHDFNVVVCCPKGYWKKGNVDIVCENYNVKQVDSLEELIKLAKKLKFYDK